MMKATDAEIRAMFSAGMSVATILMFSQATRADVERVKREMEGAGGTSPAPGDGRMQATTAPAPEGDPTRPPRASRQRRKGTAGETAPVSQREGGAAEARVDPLPKPATAAPGRASGLEAHPGAHSPDASGNRAEPGAPAELVEAQHPVIGDARAERETPGGASSDDELDDCDVVQAHVFQPEPAAIVMREPLGGCMWREGPPNGPYWYCGEKREHAGASFCTSHLLRLGR